MQRQVFPAGVGARVRSLATAGIATLIAQDASVAVVIVLANSRGGSGALVLYSFAWAVFFVPYAVLAVPIATSAFPELSARAEEEQKRRDLSLDKYHHYELASAAFQIGIVLCSAAVITGIIALVWFAGALGVAGLAVLSLGLFAPHILPLP